MDLYGVFCRVIYLLKGGYQWPLLPVAFPNWRTRYKHFRQRCERASPEEESILEPVLRKSVSGLWQSSGQTEQSSLCIVASLSVKNTDTADFADPARALAMFDRHRDGLSEVQNGLVEGGYTGSPLLSRCKAYWEPRRKW